MKQELLFAQLPNGNWEATATSVKGAWQLYVQLPEGKRGVRVLSRASSDEEWSTCGYDTGSDSEPSVVSKPFVSVVEEEIKVITSVQPLAANIRLG